MTYATCHPAKKHKAHGMCNACYMRERRAGITREPAPRRRWERTPRYTTACKQCEKRFHSYYPADYCSDACRAKARRLRLLARFCRICGCRGISVPLVEIPSDAGGGHLCKLCLVEGLKRAA